jgi:hypothetical protein
MNCDEFQSHPPVWTAKPSADLKNVVFLAAHSISIARGKTGVLDLAKAA